MRNASSRRRGVVAAAVLAVAAFGTVRAQAPDERFKADLLLVVAHPDDDTLAGVYLARAIYEQQKRVAVVFMTSGDSGGNQEGPERGPSLGLIRQIEGRRDLATLGITNVWYLAGRDTPGQDPRRSLASWGHGRAIADVVRVIRLTRPEVVLTWLPMQVEGENHGDHQAASVVATEAFDLAGSDTAFAEQVAAPVNQFEAALEGLRPWQPKKLYYMSDAIDTRFMEGHGPSYPALAISPAKHVPYWQFAYEQLRAHVTQYKAQLAQMAAGTEEQRRALMFEPGEGLVDPLRLVLAKSLVPGAAGGDVFEGIGSGAVRPLEPVASAPDSAAGLELGGAWHFYRRFWVAHHLPEMPQLRRQPIGPVAAGSEVRIPLRVANPGDASRIVMVTATLPAGWKEEPRERAVAVDAQRAVEVASVVIVPADAPDGIARVSYAAAEPGGGAPSRLDVEIAVHHMEGALPQ